MARPPKSPFAKNPTGVPILGQKPILLGGPKKNVKTLPRFTAEQLEEFLFDIGFGICEMKTALEMKLELISSEMGIDLTLEEGEYKERFEQNLPKVLAAFNFMQTEADESADEGVDNG